VGGLLLSRNTFLRAAVDQAIAALTADGTIPAILSKYKSPAAGKP
jgi:polar amino acid transport system substrate-binding protein